MCYRSRNRVVDLCTLTLLALLFMAIAPRPPEAPAAVVEMTNTLRFIPDTVAVATDETVEWRNTSLIVHTVTADPEQATLEDSVHLPDGAETFDSGNMQPEGVFRHTFRKPGVYTYFCIPHEGAKMRGTVIVR